MKIRFTMMVALLGVFATSRADVLLILDHKRYQAPRAIEFLFAGNVFDIEFEEGIVCTGESASQPSDGSLNLRFNDQFYALAGDVVLDFSTDPIQLLMTSNNGELVCTIDRIFRNHFALLE